LCQGGPWIYVPNLPYAAQIVETDVHIRADGAQVQQETKVFQARDSQGRTRIESFVSDNADRPAMVNLYDPSRRRFIQLFPGQRMARVSTIPGTAAIPVQRNLHVVKTATESLPGQTIHGIYAEGTQTTQVIPPDHGQGQDVVNVQETWISPDLKDRGLFQ
jgi:hypothetical protein